jgi:uncharacterized membrane protein
MKKLMQLALVAMLTTASVSPSFAQDKEKCNKECCHKCSDKCKEECKSGKCTHSECQKKCDEKKAGVKKQA